MVSGASSPAAKEYLQDKDGGHVDLHEGKIRFVKTFPDGVYKTEVKQAEARSACGNE